MKMIFAFVFAVSSFICEIASAGDPYDYKELVTTVSRPIQVRSHLFDFGKDGIGWLEFVGHPIGEYVVVIGEMTNCEGHVANPFPGATIRSYRIKGRMESSPHCIRIPKDHLNTTGWDPRAPPIKLPNAFPVATAFRYAEIITTEYPVNGDDLIRRTIHYPIDMAQSNFECDNAVLNAVYDLCKYSVWATSFCGCYVDGDRERTPYEADAYINQLCQYAIDADYSLARKSHEWLMEHPTWPTEWKQHSIMMAWADWMWTGDTRSLAKNYERLQKKLLGNYSRRDIVDWPESERDGFVMTNSNAVVDAFNCRNLVEMADIAAALGKEMDEVSYRGQARLAREKFLSDYLDAETGIFVDSVEVRHSSLHANAIALAFSLVPTGRVDNIVAFLERKGMACSVYFAQYLLEAFCAAGRADLAVRLMASSGNRSWRGMMDFGSTITMEAWNVEVKPNLDINHAWGAAPVNIIARYLLGVTPIEAGYRKISVRPQLGGLKRIKGAVPTVQGRVLVDATESSLHVSVPSSARVLWKGRVKEVEAGEYDFK